MSVESFTPTPLIFTQGAAQKVKSLVEEEGNPRLMLRVFVTGGGCSGFQYGFTFDEEVADDDTIVAREGVSLVVDPMSFQYLAGAEVDYQEGLEGSRFVINNPNASTTCGCGQSFSILAPGEGRAPCPASAGRGVVVSACFKPDRWRRAPLDRGRRSRSAGWRVCLPGSNARARRRPWLPSSPPARRVCPWCIRAPGAAAPTAAPAVHRYGRHPRTPAVLPSRASAAAVHR